MSICIPIVVAGSVLVAFVLLVILAEKLGERAADRDCMTMRFGQADANSPVAQKFDERWLADRTRRP